jgi:hypothetical protein
MSQNVTTPVGRLVQGSLYTAQKRTEPNGTPKLGRDGNQIVSFYFALAVPKGTERHWSQTAWGGTIWAEGHKAHPNFAPHPTFSWKVEDGDSGIPNKKGRKNKDQEGFPGNWILKFSSSFAPRVYNKDGTQELPESNYVKPGYFVQVNFDVAGNTGDSPGVYLNHRMVAFSAYGPEIAFGPDPASAGFGQAPLPPGASATPPAGLPVPPAIPTEGAPYPGTPVTAAASPSPTPAAGAPSATSPSSPPPPPNPAFLQVPPAPSHVMLPAAQGATYGEMIVAGWTDALLVQHGMMAA